MHLITKHGSSPETDNSSSSTSTSFFPPRALISLKSVQNEHNISVENEKEEALWSKKAVSTSKTKSIDYSPRILFRKSVASLLGKASPQIKLPKISATRNSYDSQKSLQSAELLFAESINTNNNLNFNYHLTNTNKVLSNKMRKIECKDNILKNQQKLSVSIPLKGERKISPQKLSKARETDSKISLFSLKNSTESKPRTSYAISPNKKRPLIKKV